MNSRVIEKEPWYSRRGSELAETVLGRLGRLNRSPSPDPPLELIAQLRGVADPLTLYGAYRDYLKHEDELINRRLSWNLTLQGFLFTAYGLTLNIAKDAKPDNAKILHQISWLHWVLPLLGILISWQSWIGIVAAQDAIDALKNRWIAVAGCLARLGRGVPVPLLTGGGRHKANRLGKIAQYIPGTVILAWMLILLENFAGYVEQHPIRLTVLVIVIAAAFIWWNYAPEDSDAIAALPAANDPARRPIWDRPAASPPQSNPSPSNPPGGDSRTAP